MSSIKDLISRLNSEENDQRAKDEKDFESQYRKQEEMHRKLSLLKEESKKYMDTIVEALDHLTANQCAISHALEQRDNLSGLPIPQKCHGNVINLISMIISFMNNLETQSPKSDNLAVNECIKIVSANTTSTKNNTKNNLVEMQTNANHAQALLYKTNLLKKLIKTAIDNEET